MQMEKLIVAGWKRADLGVPVKTAATPLATKQYAGPLIELRTSFGTEKRDGLKRKLSLGLSARWLFIKSELIKNGGKFETDQWINELREFYHQQQFGGVKGYMLHPAQKVKLFIDAMAVLLILADIIWTPLAIGWPSFSPPYLWNLFCFGFWILEFLCKLRTAYYDSGGRSK